MRRFAYFLVVALGAALLATSAQAFIVMEPTYDVAVVDGAYGEWNLNDDFFCSMYLDGDPNQPLLAKIYLRYDCETATMYVLVLTEPEIHAAILPYEVWIQVVGRSGRVLDGDPLNDGPPSDFAWVDPVVGAPVPYAWGYEGKFPIFEGTYELIFHMLVYVDGQLVTAASAGYPDNGCWVMMDCGVVPTEPTTWGMIKQTYR